MHPAIPIALVFVGCCSNLIFLEFLVKANPGSSNLITFSQFLFIAVEGFVNASKFGTKKPVIPIRAYLFMVTLFFIVQVTNNLAFTFNISVPLHTIFRSGSLMANLILGIIILKKSYKPSKYLSVIMITIGIILATLASAKEESTSDALKASKYATGLNATSDESIVDAAESVSEFATWLAGIGLLTFALFMSARMGIFQEQIYAKHGKHPAEALFYNHALPLPLFLFMASDIYNNALVISQSELVSVAGFGVPVLWLHLIGNVITQYVCIRGVFILTTECSSLTVTLVVTLRKFVSLLFSIVYFQNPFTMLHWVGTVLVFGGTLVFTDIVGEVRQALRSSKDTKKRD